MRNSCPFFSYVTMSQNHRMAEIERHIHRSASATPLLKLGPLVYIALGHVRLGFEYLQERRLHNLSRWPVPIFDQSPSKNIFLLMFEWNFLYFNLCTLPPVISLDTTQMGLCSYLLIFTHLLYSPYQVFKHTDKLLLSLLMFRLNSPRSFNPLSLPFQTIFNPLHCSFI